MVEQIRIVKSTHDEPISEEEYDIAIVAIQNHRKEKQTLQESEISEDDKEKAKSSGKVRGDPVVEF
jgi:hypothetical protein